MIKKVNISPPYTNLTQIISALAKQWEYWFYENVLLQRHT